MRIDTTRFGPVECELDDVLHLPQGLAGLEQCRRWILLGDEQSDTLAWLQSTDCPDVALAVVSPRRFVAGIQLRIARSELQPLGLENAQDAQVLVIVSRNDGVSQNDGSITLNLKAPLVFNLSRQLGRQVTTNGDLPLQHAVADAHCKAIRIA